MLNTQVLNKQIETVLDKELGVTAENIKQNMTRNNQVATGRTLASINHKVTGVSGYIAGAEHIDTLEKGISPERSRMTSWKQTYLGLRTWYQAKGFLSGFNESRLISVATITQRQVGSVLYRKGGRFDVYSNEVDPLVKRIGEQVSDIFINTKIIE